jgi:hypothetical protein
MSDIEKNLKGLDDRLQHEAEQGNYERVEKLLSLIESVKIKNNNERADLVWVRELAAQGGLSEEIENVLLMAGITVE